VNVDYINMFEIQKSWITTTSKFSAFWIFAKHILFERNKVNVKAINMDLQDGKEDFAAEDADMIVKTSIDSVLRDSMYNASKVKDWSNSIIDSILKGLQSLNRPFKYIVTALIVQKNGAGLVSTASTYWDTNKDGVCKVTWENDTIHTLITVYGLSVLVDAPAAEED